MLCGNPESFGDGSPLYKLQSNRPLYYVRDALPRHSQDEIAIWIAEGFRRWGSVADIEGRRIMSMSEAGPADIVNVITVADLGGNGILADQQLAAQGVRIYTMRINSRINWQRTNGPMQQGTIDPDRTVAHELGHFFGFQHFPSSLPKELMEPRILQDIIGPQPTEAKMAASWFGQPKPTNTPQPVPDAPAWEFVVMPDDTAIVKRRGVLQRVTPSLFAGS